jgi:CRP-like cAMP-binding protein
MFIQQLDLFKDLSKPFLDELLDIMNETKFDKGEFLFKEGEPARYFYILQEGQVKLNVGGNAHTVNIACNPGESFGWSCLVGFDTYTATAECLMPSKLYKVGKDRMNALLDKYPTNGMVFFKKLAAVIGQRLVNTYDMLVVERSAEKVPSYG